MRTLDVVEFGDQLLHTLDLDPVYVAIVNAKLPEETLSRLLLAYWCFYSLGTAARIAESKTRKQFWERLQEAALNEGFDPKTGTKPWPRGAERRHFRGVQATSAVAELVGKYGNTSATGAVVRMMGMQPHTFKSVMAAVKTHRGFGDWIAFKIADMSERVLGLGTDFSDCYLGIYKDPRQGAALLYHKMMEASGDPGWQHGPKPYAGIEWQYPITDTALAITVDHYVRLWRKKRAKAPPFFDRPVNVQEIETIFCKYKSHYKGHYYVGKDIHEVGHGLVGCGDLADQLRKELPPCPSAT